MCHYSQSGTDSQTRNDFVYAETQWHRALHTCHCAKKQISFKHQKYDSATANPSVKGDLTLWDKGGRDGRSASSGTQRVSPSQGQPGTVWSCKMRRGARNQMPHPRSLVDLTHWRICAGCVDWFFGKQRCCAFGTCPEKRRRGEEMDPEQTGTWCNVSS